MKNWKTKTIDVPEFCHFFGTSAMRNYFRTQNKDK